AGAGIRSGVADRDGTRVGRGSQGIGCGGRLDRVHQCAGVGGAGRTLDVARLIDRYSVKTVRAVPFSPGVAELAADAEGRQNFVVAGIGRTFDVQIHFLKPRAAAVVRSGVGNRDAGVVGVRGQGVGAGGRCDGVVQDGGHSGGRRYVAGSVGDDH